MRRTTPRYAFTLLALLTVAAASQPAAQQSRQTRTPERGGDVVSIQFAAVTDAGTPVADLRAEDVKIRLGGRERAVRSLQLVTFDEAGADLGLPPPYGTNALSKAGRSFIVAIDEDSFRPGLEGVLRGAVDGLLARLGPSDNVALVTMPYGGVKVPFTSDHTRVKLAMSKIVGQAPSTESAAELACRTGRTLEALVAFLDNMGVQQDPSTMLFVTSALAGPRRTVLQNMRASTDPQGSGMCELMPSLFERVGTAAGAARTRFYVIRPADANDKGLQVNRESSAGSDHPLAGIEHLVGVTEGKLLALTGSTGTAMDRVVRENAAYYVASVAAQTSDFSGRAQQLDVDVSRRGVEVRSLPSLTLATDPATANLSRPSLRDMMTTNHVFRDLPLRAGAFAALATEGEKIRVVVIAEPANPGVKLESAVAGLYDPDGKLVAQWTATPEELQRPTVMGAVSVAPGGYRVRVAAIDTAGRAGSADHEVVAEVVQSGPLKLSSLVLGLSRQGNFLPRLLFTDEPLALAYVELEGAPSGARVNAALEIAQTLNGPALITVPLAIDGSGENRYKALGSVPIGALPPGDYIARAVVGLEGHPLTRVVRTVRKAAVSTASR
jgi:hypothetical protein